MQKFFIYLFAVVAFAACGSDDNIDENIVAGQRIPLSVSTNLTTLTRAFTETQGGQIVEGEKVYLWVDDYKSGRTPDEAIPYIAAWKLTAKGDGGWKDDTSDADDNKVQYYPTTGNNVDIYALHGNFKVDNSGTLDPYTFTYGLDGDATSSLSGATAFPTSIIHVVEQDQSAAGNFEKSDMLFAKATNKPRQTSSHALDFKHLLSKIEVKLYPSKNGMSVSKLAGATVELLNIKPQTTVTLNKAVDADAQTIGAAAGTAIDVTMRKTEPTTAESETFLDDEDAPATPTAKDIPIFAEAIIVPQYFSSDGTSTGTTANFIKVTLSSSNGGGVFYAALKQEFETGKKYTYYVKAGLTTLSVTSSITAWGAGNGTGQQINAGMD